RLHRRKSASCEPSSAAKINVRVRTAKGGLKELPQMVGYPWFAEKVVDSPRGTGLGKQSLFRCAMKGSALTREHSLEVQLPTLDSVLPFLRVVQLVRSRK